MFKLKFILDFSLQIFLYKSYQYKYFNKIYSSTIPNVKMGCNESIQTRRHVGVPITQFDERKFIEKDQQNRKNDEIQQKVDKDKRRFRQDQPEFGFQTQINKKSHVQSNQIIMENTLQEICKKYPKDSKKFLQQIQGLVSNFYISLSQKALSQMNRDEITVDQSKIIIYEGILLLNLTILKVIGKNNKFNFDQATFKGLNDFQHSLVGYIKLKYPRGQTAFQSDQLNQKFRQFDRVSDLNYDILINSNTYFGDSDDNTIIKNVKVFINKIIKECEQKYPDFEKMMRNQVFCNTNKKGIKEEKGEKEIMNFKIGMKISQNVTKYTKFDTGVLEIFSPQVFRVLIKWMQDLEGIIFKTREKISKKQSFKRYIGEKFKDQKDQKKIQFNEINREEYSQVVDKLIEKIEEIGSDLKKQNQSLLEQMGKFNESLLRVFGKVNPKQKYVPIKEVDIIKFSCFNAQFVEYILTQKLVFSIKELIKVGQSIAIEKMIKVDPISFRITDLMRCMFTGNKKEILQVHKNFMGLEEKGEIDIIKVKNRLSTPLNDVMIIFKMKDSWIICEAQLILSVSNDKIHKNKKNIDHINHFFYELERSPYGILSQIAVLLAYKDIKISYDNKITFEQSKVGIDQCRKEHNDKVEVKQEQITPFICSKCSCFYGKHQNMFTFYQCSECIISVCGKCILKQNPYLEKSFTMQSIERSLIKKIDNLEKQKRKRKSNEVSKSKKTNKITAQTLLAIFYENKLKFTQKFGRDKNKVLGSKLMKQLKQLNQLNDDYDDGKEDKNYYFLIIKFQREEADFKFYSFHPRKKLIENTFDPKENYNQNSFYSYSDYDMLLMLQKQINKPEAQSLGDQHLLLSITRSQLQEMMENIKDTKNNNQYQITQVELTKDILLVIDYSVQGQRTQYKIEFQHPQFKVFAQKNQAIKGKNSTIQFDNIGIDSNHLQYFKSIQWKSKIKILRITKNKIYDIGVILQNCLNLEKLYFSENQVKKLCFTKKLPNLKTLHGSQNQIKNVEGLDLVKNLEKLILGGNNLEDLPKLNDLTKLNILNLERNSLKNLSNILKTQLPELHLLFISNQFHNYSQKLKKKNNSNGNQKQTQSNSISIKFPKLKLFQCSQNPYLFPDHKIQISSQSLESITLHYCGLNNVTFASISCIKNLKYLYLGQNELDSFDFLHSLQKNIKNSKLGENSENQGNKTCKNDSLIELDLSENQFKSLPVMRFSSLKKIMLSNNKLENITNLQKSKLPQLQFLELSNNKFKEICQLSLGKLKELELCNIQQQSSVKNLFSTQSNLVSLKKITISDCKIDFFSFDITNKNNTLSNLKELHFKNVILNSIKEDSLFQIESLATIVWHKCSINSFPIMKLQGLTKLEINLRQQSLGTFKNLQKCDFPKLQTLKIQVSVSQEANYNQVSTINAPKLKILYIQGLKIVNLGKFLKNSLGSLQQVVIQNCQVKIFSEDSIAKLKSIQKLTLKKSKLRNFICSKPLNEITYLDLSENDLKCFPLVKAKKLTQLKIEGNKFTDISKLENCDLPLLQKIKLYSCRLSKSKFPKLNFPRLEKLQLTYCNLKDMSNFTKSNLPQLKRLVLLDNEIQILPEINFPKLTYLELTCTSIRTNLKLQNLYALQIRNNIEQFNMTKIALPQFQNIKNLKRLQIYFSCLGELPQLKINLLQRLVICQCQLKNINEFAKGEYKFLEQLELSHNQITSIPELFMEELRIANFWSNKISNIEEFLLSSFLSLQQLNLQNNQLYNLETINFRSIRQLDLSQNPLKRLDFFILNQYPQLEFIDVSYTQITYVESFPKMPKLQAIFFYFSKLKDIDWLIESSENLSQLQHLSLQDNLITQLPNVFDIFPNLYLLQIWGNPLKNIYGLLQYQELQNQNQLLLNLDLEYQQIKKIQQILIGRNLKIQVEKYSLPKINQQQPEKPPITKIETRCLTFNEQDESQNQEQ